MATPEITPDEQTALAAALLGALDPLASALRARATGQPEHRMWDGDPADVALTVLAGWKLVDAEVKRLTAVAAGTAGSYGASYEQLGAAWGITRQGARKKWPDAVPRPSSAGVAPVLLELFDGEAELTQDPATGHWTWIAQAADGSRGTPAPGAAPCTSREEAAAYAGAYLREFAAPRD
ncbi:hypothetical protein ABZW10_32725 [Kitasatospora sp. NPDC004723]|uniref:hypothetical protein n=1 Tax=Kitasatospora sp. NPDC004723 TaxID=3154288 RepID=UPI0033AC3849